MLLLVLFFLASGELLLSIDSLTLQEREVFTDEFPACIPSNVSGSRRLLRFALSLSNTGPELVDTLPPLQYSYGAASGTIQLACLRDTRCRGETTPRFYTCGALSVNCTCELSAHLPCQWIDVTDLPPSPLLQLQLGSTAAAAAAVPPQLARSHRALRIVGVTGALFFPNLALILLMYKL
jgi:hypothetical protein